VTARMALYVANPPMDAKYEEDAAVWLWAEPRILSWPRGIEWLWSPVNGNSDWRLGDLWGIDEHGQLVVLESKWLGRGDPFEDFAKHPLEPPFRDARKILERWEELYNREIQNGVKRGRPGVLPNSRNSRCLKRWPALKKTIERRIHSREYSERVRTFLARRGHRDDAPRYCGLYVTFHSPRAIPVKVWCSRVSLQWWPE
jgi:hypothetical protein